MGVITAMSTTSVSFFKLCLCTVLAKTFTIQNWSKSPSRGPSLQHTQCARWSHSGTQVIKSQKILSTLSFIKVKSFWAVLESDVSFYNETSNLQFLPLRRSWRRLHIVQQPGWVELRRGSSETFCKMEIGNLKVENANQD